MDTNSDTNHPPSLASNTNNKTRNKNQQTKKTPKRPREEEPTSMDPSSTPLSHRSKPRLRTKLSDDLATPPSKRNPPSPLSLHDLLLLSPSASPSPHRKPRPPPPTLLFDEMPDSPASATPRRKGKTRASGASPRNTRRARRRLEKEIVLRDERESVPHDDGHAGRVRKRRQSRPKVSRQDQLCLVPSIPSPTSASKIVSEDSCNGVDGLWELLSELVMWKNVAKSALWFGSGSIFFISSCFSRDFSLSIISAVSQLGVLILCVAFFYDCLPQRQQQKPRGVKFQLTEDDVLKAVRLILPTANAALAKSQELFSGEPSMTLKVAPILLFMAKYGHLITPWRLLATGFFLSFTVPKLYSFYSEKIQRQVEEARSYACEAWKSCPRKKFVAASTAMLLWNMFSVKMRMCAAFISIVAFRHHQQQHRQGENDERESREGGEQAMMSTE